MRDRNVYLMVVNMISTGDNIVALMTFSYLCSAKNCINMAEIRFIISVHNLTLILYKIIKKKPNALFGNFTCK